MSTVKAQRTVSRYKAVAWRHTKVWQYSSWGMFIQHSTTEKLSAGGCGLCRLWIPYNKLPTYFACLHACMHVIQLYIFTHSESTKNSPTSCYGNRSCTAQRAACSVQHKLSKSECLTLLSALSSPSDSSYVATTWPNTVKIVRKYTTERKTCDHCLH